MTPRQARALAHPLDYADGQIPDQLKRISRHPRGFLVLTILAVDR